MGDLGANCSERSTAVDIGGNNLFATEEDESVERERPGAATELETPARWLSVL